MANTQEISIHDKREQFVIFTQMLSEQFGIDITFGIEKSMNTINLPDISGYSIEKIDFLYSLCLRQVALILRSRKTNYTPADFKTYNDVLAASTVDQIRCERHIIRRFAGAAEFLERHYAIEAHNPELTKATFGFNPNTATEEQIFFTATKWKMLGSPNNFHWDKLFPVDKWNEALSVLASVEADEIIQNTKLDSFNAAKQIGSNLLTLYYTKTKKHDESKTLENNSPEQQAWNSAKQKIEHDLQAKLNALHEKTQEIRDKISAEKERIAVEQGNEKPKELRALYKSLRNELKKYEGMKSFEKGIRKNTKAQIKTQNEIENINKNGVNPGQEQRAEHFKDKAELEEQKMANINDHLQEKMAMNRTAMPEEKQQKLDAQIERLEKRLEARQARKDALEEKIVKATEATSEATKQQELQNVAQQLANLQKQQEQLMQQAEQQLKENGSTESFNDAMQHSSELKQQKSEVRQQLNNMLDSQFELRNMKEELRKEQFKHTYETQKELKKIEQDMKAQGIDVQLTPQMDKMEGWDEANHAQANFDDKASKELERSVINGEGGGIGNRDLTMQIDKAIEGINAVDPNEIFKELENLNPMANLSDGASGELEKEDSNVNKRASKHTTELTSKIKHTVFSKKFDVIKLAPKNNKANVISLKKQYAKSIADTKKVFAKRFKPSYKLKFKGNKEEGDIDGRSIWKLAAKLSDDYYEVAVKKIDKTSSATIMVDMSGSLATLGDNANEKLQALTLHLAEGLEEVGINYEILGYHAPIETELQKTKIPEFFNRRMHRLETLVVKSFKDKTINGISELKVQQTENSDGESVRIGVSRLKRQKGKVKLLFLLSDGKPYMQTSDPAILDADLLSALQFAHQNKIVVFSIGFTDNHPVLGDSHIHLEQITDLPKKLKEKL